MCGHSCVFVSRWLVTEVQRTRLSIPVLAPGCQKIHVLFGLFGYLVAVFNCHVDNGLVCIQELVIIILSLSGDQQRSCDEQQDQW
uniref:Uncharacterized protein n=1 Tax=Anguilla anguilla TaxID=7936 RepID=A0A0E9UH40_ANGAN